MESPRTKISRLLAQTDEERLKRLLEVQEKVGVAIDLVQWARNNLAGSNHNLENAHSHLLEYFSHISACNRATILSVELKKSGHKPIPVEKTLEAMKDKGEKI